MALLQLDEFAAWQGLNQKRETEKLAAQYLVREVLGDPALVIGYGERSEPRLKGDVQISISHAYDKLAVLFSYNGVEVGIDIERVQEKILKIKEKFLSHEELEQLKGAGLFAYTIYWAVKEAVYKAHGTAGLLFAGQIAVEPFTQEQAGVIKARVTRPGSEKNYLLHYQALEDYVLVYTDNLE